MAYMLLCALRRLALPQTPFAKATCGTIPSQAVEDRRPRAHQRAPQHLRNGLGATPISGFALAHAQLANAAARRRNRKEPAVIFDPAARSAPGLAQVVPRQIRSAPSSSATAARAIALCPLSQNGGGLRE